MPNLIRTSSTTLSCRPPRPQRRRLQADPDRLRARPQIGSSARRLSPRGRRRLRVESLGHARHTEGCRRALAGHSGQSPTRQAASAPIRRREAQSHRRGDPQANGDRVHQRGIPSRMACQPCACEKERREMADVCRLHWSEQSMSESSLPSASHRSNRETLSFLDAYSGYHQIRMKESDQLATSFITPFGMYCYVTMPFGLRNAGATYERCMNHVFGEHIGRKVEAYVDDIVVKMRKASNLLSDLETTFRCLKAKGVKLNPEKCVFGVPRGMLLGFIVSERGIEANPEKIAAITNMGPIKDLKGVQGSWDALRL